MPKLLLKLCALLTITLSSMTIAGCWDYKNIDRMNYLTSLSIDYENEQFVVYLQSAQFSEIARREGAPVGAKQNDVVGIGKGKSIADAMFKVYKSEQFPIYWGHIKTVIFTKRALRNVGIIDLTDLINRYREIRYNLWLFGTDEPIERLLNAFPFYNRSLYDSLMMKPDESYRQFSYIKPVYLYRFLSDTYERGKTVMIPRLTIDSSSWLEGGKPISLLIMDGAFFFKGTDFLGTLTTEQLIGKRYLDEKMFRVPLTIENEENPVITFVVRMKKFKVRYAVRDGRLNFNLDIKVKAFIDEMQQNLDEAKMRQLLEQEVEKTVRSTYDAGKNIGADILNLGYPIFKYHHSDWKSYLRGEGFASAALGSVRVRAMIIHSGKYKGRIAESPKS